MFSFEEYQIVLLHIYITRYYSPSVGIRRRSLTKSLYNYYLTKIYSNSMFLFFFNVLLFKVRGGGIFWIIFILFYKSSQEKIFLLNLFKQIIFLIISKEYLKNYEYNLTVFPYLGEGGRSGADPEIMLLNWWSSETSVSVCKDCVSS